MQQVRSNHTDAVESSTNEVLGQLGASRVGCVLAVVVLTTLIEAFFLVSSVPLWSLN